MKRLMVASWLALASTFVEPATASADPTPAPTPGYQITGASGPQFPGAQVYPPQCLRNTLACGFRYDPGSGTWQPGTGSP
jgi:hypothetical protein